MWFYKINQSSKEFLINLDRCDGIYIKESSKGGYVISAWQGEVEHTLYRSNSYSDCRRIFSELRESSSALSIENIDGEDFVFDPLAEDEDEE